jgi:phospholipase/carboxylesterase
MIIPLELQQRTWAYLHGDSGAQITGHRDGGGHGLTRPAGDALRAWLAQRIA